MSTIKKNVRKSGLYPWGEGTPFSDAVEFTEAVFNMFDSGKSEKEMIKTINDMLSDERKLTIPEFRIVKHHAHEIWLNNYNTELYNMVREGKSWKEIAEHFNETTSSVQYQYEIIMLNFGGLENRWVARRALLNALFDELKAKKLVIINDGHEKFHVSKSLFDEVVYILKKDCGFYQYVIKYDAKSKPLIILGSQCGREYVEAHLSEVKVLDSHQLA